MSDNRNESRVCLINLWNTGAVYRCGAKLAWRRERRERGCSARVIACGAVITDTKTCRGGKVRFGRWEGIPQSPIAVQMPMLSYERRMDASSTKLGDASLCNPNPIMNLPGQGVAWGKYLTTALPVACISRY
jgi:hypothetical protein